MIQGGCYSKPAGKHPEHVQKHVEKHVELAPAPGSDPSWVQVLKPSRAWGEGCAGPHLSCLPRASEAFSSYRLAMHTSSDVFHGLPARHTLALET